MKKAVLIGINYNGSSAQLNGCINDTKNVYDILVKNFGYKPENIVMINDESQIKPTRDNILSTPSVHLCSGCSRVERVLLSFSFF